MNICLVFVATHKYIKYLEPVIISVRENFLVDHNLSFLVFSNHKIKLGSTVRSSYIQHKPFPEPTLKRYHYIKSESSYLKEFDYIFYLDVDMRVVDSVGDEILGDMTATIHPGFYNKPNTQFFYERDRRSTAYIPQGEGVAYYAGGFLGGRPEPFLKMARVISKNIDKDSKKRIVAVWHDESHLNRYLLDNPPTLILPPDYCNPEAFYVPFKKKIIALNKNHEEMRC